MGKFSLSFFAVILLSYISRPFFSIHSSQSFTQLFFSIILPNYFHISSQLFFSIIFLVMFLDHSFQSCFSVILLSNFSFPKVPKFEGCDSSQSLISIGIFIQLFFFVCFLVNFPNRSSKIFFSVGFPVIFSSPKFQCSKGCM